MSFCKKISKKTIALFALALTALLMFFGSNAMIAHAESKPSLTGVSLSGSVLSWDDFAGADHYYIYGYPTDGYMSEGEITTTSIDLYQFFRKKQRTTGDYTVEIFAMDDSYNEISSRYETIYSYTSTAIPLDTPTNLQWTGATISWNPVPNAYYYSYEYYIDGAYQYGTNIYGLNNTSTEIPNLRTCVNYTFKVTAFPKFDDYDHIESAEAESAVKNYPNVVPSFTNVEIDSKGILTFDAIPYADKYEYSVSYAGGYFSSNTIDLYDKMATHAFESGTYDIKLRAFGENGEPLCPEYVISAWEYDSSKAPQTLTGTTTITGELKYGATLTADLIDSNNTGTVHYYWVRYKFGESTIVEHGKTYTVVQADIGGQLMAIAESSVEKNTVESAKTGIIQKADGPAAPTSVNSTNCTTDEQNNGTITGVTSAMEYKLSTGEWTSITGTSVTGLAPGTYYVRYKENDTTKASEQVTTIINAYEDLTKYAISVTGGYVEIDSVMVTESSKGLIVTIKAENIPAGYVFNKWVSSDVTFANANSETTTFTMVAKNVAIEATYSPATLTGTATISGDKVYGGILTANFEASNNTGDLSYQWYRGSTPIVGATNMTYTLTADDVERSIKVEVTSSIQTGSVMSSVTTAIQKASASAPTGINSTACTTDSNNDGIITGVNTSMEYKLGEGAWMDVTGTTITNLVPGTYYVRLKETATHMASSSVTTVVSAYEAPMQYGITVDNGTSSLNIAEENVVITITAGTAPSGKEFDKWVSSDVTVLDANSETTTFTMPAKNVTVTATYRNIQYTISFDVNGGSGSMANVSKEYNESFVLPANTLTAPADKEFKCWSVNDVEMNVGDEITVKANVSIKAIWKDIEIINYEVIFDANGGSGSMVKVDINGEYTLPASTLTAPTGKQFKCWSVDGVEMAVGAKINVSKNTTIKAVWEDVSTTPSTPTDPTPSTPTTPEEPTPSTPTEPKEDAKGGLNGGAIAGIVIGSIVLVAVAAYFALGFTLYKSGKLTGKFFETIFKWIKK